MQHYTLKIAVVGDSGVGKSALALRLATKRFRSAHDATIGVEFQVHTLDVSAADGTPRRVKLQIWDTAGQEQFMALTRNYFRNIAGAIIVYAVDNPTSMSNVERWVGEIRHHNPDVEVPILVCGNKADLADLADGDTVAYDPETAPGGGAVFGVALASARTGQGVEGAFRILAERILSSMTAEEVGPSLGVRVHPGAFLFDAAAPDSSPRGGDSETETVRLLPEEKDGSASSLRRGEAACCP